MALLTGPGKVFGCSISGVAQPHAGLSVPRSARQSPPVPVPAAWHTTQCLHAHSGRSLAVRQPSIVCHGQPGLVNLPLDLPLEQPLAGFDSIRSALDDLAQGKFLVVLDDENRENEGDLIIAADKITTESMAFMVEHTSGVICVAMEGKDMERLRLPLMVSSAENEESMFTAFTVTVDLKEGVTTGISAADRARTIRHMATPSSVASEFRRPGHIFPLRYRPGGVLVRPGHTEASLDLARLAGCYPAGVLCEIVNREDGSMARAPMLLEFAKSHGLKCITIADLIRYRLHHEQLVTLVSSATSLSRHGPITSHAFHSTLDSSEHVAFVVGQLPSQATPGSPQSKQLPPVLVHVHQESSVADVLAGSGSLDAALAQVAAQGQGVVLWMRTRLEGLSPPSPSQEISKAAQDMVASSGSNSSRPAVEIRVFGQATQMLRALGVTSVTVLPGADPQQAQALASCGLDVHSAASNGTASKHAPSGSPSLVTAR